MLKVSVQELTSNVTHPIAQLSDGGVRNCFNESFLHEQSRGVPLEELLAPPAQAAR